MRSVAQSKEEFYRYTHTHTPPGPMSRLGGAGRGSPSIFSPAVSWGRTRRSRGPGLQYVHGYMSHLQPSCVTHLNIKIALCEQGTGIRRRHISLDLSARDVGKHPLLDCPEILTCVPF